MNRNMLCIIFLSICCSATHATTTLLRQATELQAAQKNALPGDTLVLKNGRWENVALVLSCKGTPAQPIYIVAETEGNVLICGKSNLRINGEWLVISGLRFENGFSPEGHVWEFRANKKVANHVTVQHCSIIGFNPPNRMIENHWIAMYGKNNTITQCAFVDKTNMGVLLAVVLDDERSRENNHLITKNYFGLRRPLGSNGGEIIRVGVSEQCTFASQTQIRYNLFDNCDGETEIVSIKSGENSVDHNLFKECQGAVVLRHGNNNVVYANFFKGNNKTGTGGVRVINEGNWVINNLFEQCKGTGFRAPLAIMNGVFNSPANRYLPVKNAFMAYNSFVDCSPIGLCVGSDTERTVPPQNSFLVNNDFKGKANDLVGKAFDKTNGIMMKGNSIAKGMQHEFGTGFAVKNKAFEVPDSLRKIIEAKTGWNCPATTGVAGALFWQALEKECLRAGTAWSNTTEAARPKKQTAPQTFTCPDGPCIEQIFSSNSNEKGKRLRILLTGKQYAFTQTLQTKAKIELLGQNQKTAWMTAASTAPVFDLAGESELNLRNLSIDATQLKNKDFVVADSSGSSFHFNIGFDHIRVNGFGGEALIKINKNAYADSIKVNRSIFNNCKTNVLVAVGETANKGLYGAEKIKLTNNQFHHHNGSIVELYRGGNDESTMGPQLLFSNNELQQVSHHQPLFHLYGVQLSVLNHNNWSNANPKGVLVRYEDKVYAIHLYQNNHSTAAGKLETNQFFSKNHHNLLRGFTW